MEIRPSGPPNARVMVVVDCPSYSDLHKEEFLAGSGGMEFNKMLAEVGLNRSECFVTSVVRRSIPGADISSVIATRKADITPMHRPIHSKMALEPYLTGVHLLEREIDLVKPRVILALGNGALFALTGKWGISSWRGSELRYTSPGGHECIVLPTRDGGYINSVWKDRGVVLQDLRRAKAASLRETLPPPRAYNFIIRPNFSKAVSTLNTLLRSADEAVVKLAVDIETRGGHIACVGIGWSLLDAICIPLMRDGNQHYWLTEEEAFIAHLLYRLLTHSNVEVIGQNFLYDAQYFYRHLHFIPRFKRDTMITQHTLRNAGAKGLDFLSSLWCEEHIYWKDESKDWDPKLGEEQLWVYNCKDCVITFEVDEAQGKAVSSLSASWPALQEILDFQQSLFYPVLNTMNRGIRVDQSSRERLSAELAGSISEREQWIETAVGHPLNIKSPKQMTDFFYRELAQKEIRSRKTKGLTADDAALEKLGQREPLLLPLLGRVAELRSLGVFRSTFIEAPTDTDGRMRCSFNIGGTATYRFSSSQNAFNSGMNLQNLPSGDEEGLHSSTPMPNIRKLFLPDHGYEFFDIDLDSADLRIVVEEADVGEMREWLREGKKPYVEVAKEYYKDPTIDKNHPSYKFFKAFCHATHYLGTPHGMADRINQHCRMYGIPSLTVVEIERLQKWYFDKFRPIKDWHEKIKTQVSQHRFVENIFGYRMWFMDRIEGNVFNEAVASIPQSTVACLINRGYVNLHNNHPEIEVLLQVHDSLAGQYPTEIARRLCRPLHQPVPCLCHIKIH
jgi:DNA polymerase I-like protein with 3'-5' exonuclease and polymerase domains/uracil-DNA glycosylase